MRVECKGLAMKEKKVIGIAGMPGAGKAVVKEIIQKMGYPVVVMGDVIRDEVKRRGLESTPENLGFVMLKLREEEGPAVVARRCIPQIRDAKENVIVIDGIRSSHEVKEFKKHFPFFTLVAIHASPETRFTRLSQRKRGDDPKTWKTFKERDYRELSVGLGDVIAIADHIIVNEEGKDQLRKQFNRFLTSVVGK